MTWDTAIVSMISGQSASTAWPVLAVQISRPKESLKDQLLEGQANLLRMLEFVQLTEEEKLLVTEGVELHQALIEQLADTPTPTGLTPREMETRPVGETAIIPLPTVRPNERKRQGQ